MSEEREMTLAEWVGRLPRPHLAHREYTELKTRNEALEKAAQGARSLLWNMQNGRVLEYSKPMIAMAIKDIDAALLQEPTK